MENNNPTKRMHPLVAGAAISVILVSLTGVAAITGLIPNSHSTTAPAISEAPAAATGVNTLAADAPAVPVAKADESAAVVKPATVHRTETRTAKLSQSQPRTTYSSHSVAQAPAICSSCGRVESVQPIQHQAKASGVGVVAGAVLGGVLGNQVGGGNGRTLATVAGAVGGGYAGNEIEKRTRSTTSYQVRVRMEDGSVRSFPFAQQPGWNVGDHVRVVNGHLTARA
ncbi:MAG TPA: glycine zipper 2TM domain-containing protein [Noviherbaspirillum sp.]|nr:glycine zipper 2TM domain-containing protein [Noviherbaspirillum sp.]